MFALMLVSHGLLLIPYLILAWLMPSKPIEQDQGFTNAFNFMGGQTKNNKKRKEIKNVEEHDVNE